jgi:AcrR family transcriptional regulator
MPLPDDTEQRLLAAAVRVFAEKGYEGATVRDICQQAQVKNIAAVNYYFRDKERLYIEAVKSACACQQERYPLPDWPPGTPAVEKLRGFIRTLASRMADDGEAPWHRQLFLRELAHPTAACAEVVQTHIGPMAERLAQILQELLPALPERKRALIAFSIVGQCVYHKVARPITALLVGEEEHRAYDATLLADHIIEFSLAALGLGKPCGAGSGKPASTRPRG